MNRVVGVIVVSLALLAMSACPDSSRLPYQKGMALMQAQEYGPALDKFDESLAADPDLKMPLFGRARCLYQLDRFEEALEAYEKFLVATQQERTKYGDERFDAEFYRDKCKLELGQEVPQDPEAIPEERMRY